MKQYSNKNTVSLSDGTRITRKTLEYRIGKAKEEKLRLQYEEHGYNFCERTGLNANYANLQRSHIVSVKECINKGEAELAYNLNNLEILDYDEHIKIEKMKNPARLLWFTYKAKGWTFAEFSDLMKRSEGV